MRRFNLCHAVEVRAHDRRASYFTSIPSSNGNRIERSTDQTRRATNDRIEKLFSRADGTIELDSSGRSRSFRVPPFACPMSWPFARSANRASRRKHNVCLHFNRRCAGMASVRANVRGSVGRTAGARKLSGPKVVPLCTSSRRRALHSLPQNVREAGRS